MADRVVRFVLVGDNKSAVRAMEETSVVSAKTGRTLEHTGKRAEASFLGIEKGAHRMRHTISTVVGVAGFGSLAFGLRDVVKAGQSWEQQQAQLQLSLKNTGQAGARNMRLLDDAIKSTSTHGGFAPQDEAQGLSTFVRLTGNATKAANLNREAINFARGAHVDYGTAVQRVAQIQTGNVGRLQRYLGIVTPVKYHVQSLTALQKKLNPELLKHAQVLDKQATAAKANAIIQRKFGGAAGAYSHTTAGAIENAKHTIDLVSERIGKVFLPYVAKAAQWAAKMAERVLADWPKISATAKIVFGDVKNVLGTVVKVIKGVVEWSSRHKTITQILAVVVISLAGGLWAMHTAIEAVAFVTRIWTGVQAALNIVMDANPIGIVIVAIGAITAAVVYCYFHFKTFRNVVQGVFGWLKNAVKNTVDFFKKHWTLIATVIAGPFAPLVLMITHLKEVKKLAKDIIGLPGKALHAASHIASGVVHSASFGLFNRGGLVPGFASGGPVHGPGGVDTIPARLTAGEFVLRKEVVSAIGVSRLNAINASGHMASDGTFEATAPVVIKLGDRVIAETVVRHQLRMRARA